MVDALASGASVLTGVEVQVLSWAPINFLIHSHIYSKSLIFYRFCDPLLNIAYHHIPHFLV